MSAINIRHIKKALTDQFTGLIDLSDWPNAGEAARESVFLTRALAAYALGNLLDLDPHVSAACVTDGGDDNGVDALAIADEGSRLLLVQSKWDVDGRGGPSVEATQKLAQGLRDLVVTKFDRFNEKVNAREQEIYEALDTIDLRIELIFIHTGQADLSPHATRVFDDLLEEMNDVSDMVSYQIIKQSDVYAFVTGLTADPAINLEVSMSDYGVKSDPYVAYYGQVAAEDVAAWHQEYGHRLFSKNLRKFISDSEVNQSITLTVTDDPDDFWYFNNGITVLCDKVERKPIGGSDRRTGQFSCEGVTVVNGAQTVGCVATAYARSPESVKKALVNARFISLEGAPDTLASEITRATNTQNKIERRDFVALDPEQERLKRELRIENGKEYALKTGESDPDPDKGCSILEATVALACASEDPGLAVLAKREIGRLWEDISKPPYRRIFNTTVSALRLWRAVLMMRALEEALRPHRKGEGRSRLIAIHGNRLILHRVFRTHASDNLDDPDLNFDAVLAAIPEEAIVIMNRMVEVVERDYASKYPASLFKNEKLCRYICQVLDGEATATHAAGTVSR